MWYPGLDLEQKEDINGKTSQMKIKSTVYLIVKYQNWQMYYRNVRC